ncbi:MAG TPA: GNAT family N-acetyltransferase [Frankiaceae bacterium]|nr:GNAT family N-acetyltransferase [Frankiaceae bacterium]
MARHRPALLPLDDDDLAREVLVLQREAYAVEAALIGSDGIPALTETVEQLRAAGESWLGVFDASGLCGAVAWRLLDDGTVDICRLVVAPRSFRGGVATALLDELDRRFPANAMIVSTGSANEPALTLYRRRGFHAVRRREAAPGLEVTELARPATGA